MTLIQQDSADETNGSPLHENGDGDGADVETPGSISEADTPPQEINTQDSATPTAAAIPLADNSLLVDISDALSEKDKVKFTVHTRTTLPGFAKDDFFVVRQHEEFVWLHDRFEENDEYAGYIVSALKVSFEVDSQMTSVFRFHLVHRSRISMRRARNSNDSVRGRAI